MNEIGGAVCAEGVAKAADSAGDDVGVCEWIGASVATGVPGATAGGPRAAVGVGAGGAIGAGGEGGVPGATRVPAPAGTSTSAPAELTATRPSVVRSVAEPSAATSTSNFVPRTAAVSDGVWIS